GGPRRGRRMSPPSVGSNGLGMASPSRILEAVEAVRLLLKMRHSSGRSSRGDCAQEQAAILGHHSEGSEEGNQVLLLRLRQLGSKHDVEEFDGVLEREQTAVVQVRGRILDS